MWTRGRKVGTVKYYRVLYGDTTTGPRLVKKREPAKQERVSDFKEAMPQARAGKRGKITGYSAKSKRAFRREIHKLSRRWEAVQPLLVTCTLPGEDWQRIDYPAALKRLRERLRYLPQARPDLCSGPVWGVFNVEFQPRRGAAHYCLALDAEVFAQADRKELYAWFHRAWFECVGSGQETHLNSGVRVETAREVPVYLAKELSKRLTKEHKAAGAEQKHAKWWGFINRDLVRAHQHEEWDELTPDEAKQLNAELDAYWEPRQAAMAKKFGWPETYARPDFLPKLSGHRYLPRLDRPAPKPVTLGEQQSIQTESAQVKSAQAQAQAQAQARPRRKSRMRLRLLDSLPGDSARTPPAVQALPLVLSPIAARRVLEAEPGRVVPA